MPNPFMPRALVAAALMALSATSWSQAPVSSPAPTTDPSLSPSSPLARAAVTLNLAEAQRLALQRHPELAMADRELQAAVAAQTQAAARPDPTLSVQVEDLRPETRTTTVLWTQPLELGGQRSARMGVAERQRAQAAQARQSKAWDVHQQVAQAYLDLQSARQQQGLMQELLDLAQKATQAVAHKLQAGKAAPLELARAQLAEAGLRAEAAQTQGELRQAEQRLSGLVWGRSAEAPSAAQLSLDAWPSPLPQPPETALLESWLAQAPQLQQARLELERREAESQLQRSQRLPELQLSLGAKRVADAGLTQAVVGLSMPLPFSDSRQSALQQALAREAQARDGVEAAAQRLFSEAQQALTRWQQARAQHQLLGAQALKDAREAHALALRGYELGKFSLMDLLDAQRSLVQLRQQAWRAEAEVLRAALDLEHLSGRPLNATEAAWTGATP